MSDTPRPSLAGLTFTERLRALGMVSDTPAASGTNGAVSSGTVVPLRSSDQDTPYGLAALRGLCDDIAYAGSVGGRDITFNRACLRAGELIRRGDLTRRTAVDALRDAGMAVTDPSDFTEYKVTEKLQRVIAQGEQSGYETRRGPAPEPAPSLRSFEPDTPPEPDDQAAQQADAELWNARPVLAHLQTFARSRMCSPWAVLGVTLARVIVTAPSFLVLPPIVGSYASLNLFVALTGASGGGKGAAESAAADALDLGEDVYTATVGSGEGIGHLYAHRERGEVIRDRSAVLFTVPEVDNLIALASRQGATLLPQLRSAWSGERLGFSYADPKKALPLEKHTYRMGLVLGVQPGRAAPLLEDADGGTPQRFLWLPTSDPDAPDELPPTPAPISVHRPRQPAFSNNTGLVPLTVAQQAVDTIVEARRARLRGDGNALDGHALLARLKAAAALALLDGRHDVNDDDWHLSGLIMAVSDHTRSGVARYLASVAKQANLAKGQGEAMRAVQVAEHVEEAAIKRVAGHVGRRLREWQDNDRWATAGALRKALSSVQRPYFEDAIQRLVDADQVDVQTRPTTRYRWKEDAR
jgi:hypothetical protein